MVFILLSEIFIEIGRAASERTGGGVDTTYTGGVTMVGGDWVRWGDRMRRRQPRARGVRLQHQLRPLVGYWAELGLSHG
jgi:CubicO group peptidase (beta-lactamase class C family)